MEQARYWLWTKRTSEECNLGSLPDHHHHHLQVAPSRNDHDSWEEQAFAEDAAGPHGGCVWPPRSYSCSFCRREFRSAQALGGHMNVHRRDRARLKQSTPDNDHQPQNQDPLLYDFGFNDQNHEYPSQVCTLVYTSNPNSNLHPNGVMSISQSSPSRVSASTEETTYHSFTEKPFFHPPPPSPPPPLPPPISLVHQQKISIPSSKPYSLLSENEIPNKQISDPRTVDHKTKVMDPRHRPNINYAKNNDYSMILNSDVPSFDPESTIGCKRRRIDHQSSLCLFLKPSSPVENHIEYMEEVDLINTTSLQDLDLELRLGDGPKVK